MLYYIVQYENDGKVFKYICTCLATMYDSMLKNIVYVAGILNSLEESSIYAKIK